jgi:hypothetical protein
MALMSRTLLRARLSWCSIRALARDFGVRLFRRGVEDGFQITAVLKDLDEDSVSAMETPSLHG